MAEEKRISVWSELMHFVKWGKEDMKHRRFSLGMFNDMYYFQLARYKEGERGFKQKENFYLNSDNDIAILALAKRMVKKIHKLDRGEKIPFAPLTFYNNRDVTKATKRIDFLACTNEEGKYSNESISISISSRKEGEEKWQRLDALYFTNATLFSSGKEDRDILDKESLGVFMQIEAVMETCVSRTNISRDLHLKKYFNQLYDNGDNNNGSNKRSYNAKEESESSDDFPFE